VAGRRGDHGFSVSVGVHYQQGVDHAMKHFIYTLGAPYLHLRKKQGENWGENWGEKLSRYNFSQLFTSTTL